MGYGSLVTTLENHEWVFRKGSQKEALDDQERDR